MRNLGSWWVICDPPKGCGWYWEVRQVQDHWWSRPRKEYRGAYWEGSDDLLSQRPETTSSRWMTSDQFAENYGDDLPYLVKTDLTNAKRVSATNSARIRR